MLKTCTKCGIEKNISSFYYQKRNNNYYSDCKECRALASKIYRDKNKDKIKQRQLEYYKQNKESVLVRNSTYRESNKEKIQEINKKYRVLNRERYTEYCNKRYCSDIKYSIATRLRKRVYAAIKNKNKSTLKLVGCDIDFLIKHIESQFQPGMTWENRSKWHIDHIVPLSAFDLTDPEQLHKACHYTNLQPLWAKDNIRKSNKLPEDRTA